MTGTSRTAKASKNIVFDVLNKLLSIILVFVSRTVFIQKLGVDYLGLNGLFSDILGMLSLADLGFNTAMVFSLYKPLADSDKIKVSALITFYRRVYHWIAAGVLLLGLCVIPLLPYMVHLKNPINNIWIYYLFSLANAVVSYLCVYKTAVLSADQKGFIVSAVTMITNIICTGFQVLVLLRYSSYLLYLLIGSIAAISNNIISSKIASKKYPEIEEERVLNKQERHNIIDNIKSAFVYKLSSVLLSASTNIIISVVIGTAVVGYYSNYLMVQNKIVLLYSSLFTAATASIGNLIAMEKPDKRKRIFDAEQSLSFIFCSIIVPSYIVLINEFISVWLGHSYVLSVPITLIIGLNLYLGTVFQPLWSYRDATGMYQHTKWIQAICAVLNILLSVFLGMKLGLFGIIAAGAIARLATYAWYEPRVLFKIYFESEPWEYYSSVVKNLILVVLLVVMLYGVNSVWHVYTWGMWFVKAFFVFVVCLVISICTYSRTQAYSILANKVRQVFRKVK